MKKLLVNVINVVSHDHKNDDTNSIATLHDKLSIAKMYGDFFPNKKRRVTEPKGFYIRYKQINK